MPTKRSFLLGFLLSCALAWFMSAVYSDTIPPLVLDAGIAGYVYAPGSTLRYHSEGWGTTRIGVHGLKGQGAQWLGTEPLAVFWGDSFVEALQVDDEDKLDAVFTRSAREAGLTYHGLAIGRFADSVADYYFRIPRYSKLLGHKATHVIVLGTITDTLPGEQAPCRSAFRSEGDIFTLTEQECPPKDSTARLRFILYDYRLNILQLLHTRLSEGGFRFLNTPVRAASAALESGPLSVPPDKYDHAWDFLLERMKSVTPSHLVFIYAPPLPHIVNANGAGKLSFINPEAAHAARFAQRCQLHSIDFIDMSKTFIEYFRTNKEFTRGFSASPPGRGHMNPTGFGLIAMALIQHLSPDTDNATRF